MSVCIELFLRYFVETRGAQYLIRVPGWKRVRDCSATGALYGVSNFRGRLVKNTLIIRFQPDPNTFFQSHRFHQLGQPKIGTTVSTTLMIAPGTASRIAVAKIVRLYFQPSQALTGIRRSNLHTPGVVSSREWELTSLSQNENHMAIDANDAVKDRRTPGRNKKRGIYAARHFIREGEEAEYTDTVLALMEQLEPEGILEETFATEIMGATWRLRRCRLVEEAFGAIDDLDFDPMMDERTEKQQKSVDRARAQSHLILRRSLTELKKLQEGRASKPTPKPIEDPSQDLSMDDFEAMLGLSDAQLNSFCKPAEATPAATSSFCKTTPMAPKREPRNAPPVFNNAA